MGYLPQLSEIDRDRDMVREFRGLNHNDVISDGQFYDMQNLSSDAYPTLTTRKARKLCKTVSNGSAMAAGEHMAWCDGFDNNAYFYYNGAQKFACNTPSSIVHMGAYFCLFPEGIVYNSHDDTVQRIAVSRQLTATDGGAILVRFKPTISDIQPDGSKKWATVNDAVTSETEPSDTTKYWLDTGNTPIVLKKYSDSFKMWVSIPTMYADVSFEKTRFPDIADVFHAGDAITFSGFESSETGSTIGNLNGSFVLEDVFIANEEAHLIVAVATYPATGTAWELTSPTFSREMPQMDYVCESGNRLFGCSTEKHEIYASKLGDPLNWNVFSGISTDSYAATVGTPGEFTGIASYRNNVLFFKENRIHILSGTRPANFQIDTIECRGMQRLSSKSATVVNETLYYKSDSGIMAYNGNLPELVSDAFGEYNSGHVISSGTDGKKYYCCLVTGDNECNMMVYDALRGIWSREDSSAVTDFAAIGNRLYMMVNGNIYDLGTGTSAEEGQAWRDDVITEESSVSWHATTGAIGLDSPYEKYIASIMLRVQMESGGTMRVETSYDEENNFVEVARITADKLRSVTLNIVPRRCDTMRIRLSGNGSFKLFSISKEIESGGDSDGGI